MSDAISGVQGLDQIRAGYAWKQVKHARDVLKDRFPEYLGLVKKLPALISGNGLGQALAFLHSKDKNGEVVSRTSPHGLAFHHLSDWLQREEGAYRGPFAGSRGDALQALMVGDSASYQRAQLEALNILSFLRMFAAGLGREEQP